MGVGGWSLFLTGGIRGWVQGVCVVVFLSFCGYGWLGCGLSFLWGYRLLGGGFYLVLFLSISLYLSILWWLRGGLFFSLFLSLLLCLR